ncbi:hypothetical protein SDC9_159516 [bioreactor metagenome]|uniref:Uncharacterized protein n=1 Tax=bioreactor metagenome TaxID=1076179 RepID=A0A645FID1_9ZZZZ
MMRTNGIYKKFASHGIEALWSASVIFIEQIDTTAKGMVYAAAYNRFSTGSPAEIILIFGSAFTHVMQQPGKIRGMAEIDAIKLISRISRHIETMAFYRLLNSFVIDYRYMRQGFHHIITTCLKYGQLLTQVPIHMLEIRNIYHHYI